MMYICLYWPALPTVPAQRRPHASAKQTLLNIKLLFDLKTSGISATAREMSRIQIGNTFPFHDLHTVPIHSGEVCTACSRRLQGCGSTCSKRVFCTHVHPLRCRLEDAAQESSFPISGWLYAGQHASNPIATPRPNWDSVHRQMGCADRCTTRRLYLRSCQG